MANLRCHPATRGTALVAGLAVICAGCAGADHRAAARAGTAGPPASAPASAPCATIVADTLGSVARRIYGQAAAGRNVVSAQGRLARSAALAAAVRRGDPAATRAALTPLLKQQIHRIVVWRGSQVLASVGRTPALAPAQGLVRDPAGRPVGHYLLSVAEQAAITGLLRSTVGAQVAVRPAGQPVPAAAAGGARILVAARAFPRGRLTIALRLPPASLTTCGTSPAATVAATDGAIAQRLFHTEARGATVARVLRHVSRDAAFRLAVAHDDPVALRAAIIRFFRTRSLHVVRIRATLPDGRLVGDVGGPYVLAPASRAVQDAAGRTIGTVTLSVQDDTGYIKLLHRFTGAAVMLSTPAGIVPGSTRSVTAGAPADRFSFTAQAFPSGPLDVALRIPGA